MPPRIDLIGHSVPTPSRSAEKMNIDIEWVRARTSECRLLSGRLTRKQRKVKEIVSHSIVSNSLLPHGP